VAILTASHDHTENQALAAENKDFDGGSVLASMEMCFENHATTSRPPRAKQYIFHHRETVTRYDWYLSCRDNSNIVLEENRLTAKKGIDRHVCSD
jgi:pyrimidine deaminase RibD-like protein